MTHKTLHMDGTASVWRPVLSHLTLGNSAGVSSDRAACLVSLCMAPVRHLQLDRSLLHQVELLLADEQVDSTLLSLTIDADSGAPFVTSDLDSLSTTRLSELHLHGPHGDTLTAHLVTIKHCPLLKSIRLYDYVLSPSADDDAHRALREWAQTRRVLADTDISVRWNGRELAKAEC